MEIHRSFPREAWDFYRTAPFAETGVAMITLGCSFLITIDGLYNSPTVLVVGAIASLTGYITGAALINRQFSLRQRLEDSISQYGYTDKAFETTIPEWCARQTARVVVDRSGNRRQYQELCEKNRSEMELGFIPNF